MWRHAFLAGCLGLTAGPLLAGDPAPQAAAPPQAAPAAAPVKLTPKVLSLVKEQVVPAYRARDFRRLLSALQGPLATWSEGQVKAVDELLGQSQLPALAVVLAEARWDLLKFGNDERLPPPKGRELEFVLHGLAAKVGEEAKLCRDSRVFQEPIPTCRGFGDFEALLWQAHVLSNRLTATREAADYAEQQARTIRVVKQRDTELAAWAKVRSDLQDLQTELNERALELRGARVAFARGVLAESKDFGQRLQAAYAADFDGELIQSLVAAAAKTGQVPRREILRDPAWPDRVQRLAAESRQDAGELVEKGRLFFEGVHWWLRGRYGRGSQAGGLMKSPAALLSPSALVALYMPAVPPTPDDPLVSQYPTPPVDRRHHYTWLVEEKPMFVWTATYFM